MGSGYVWVMLVVETGFAPVPTASDAVALLLSYSEMTQKFLTPSCCRMDLFGLDIQLSRIEFNSSSDRIGEGHIWLRIWDLNPLPTDFNSVALPSELIRGSNVRVPVATAIELSKS